MSARLLIPPTATYEEWKAQRAELSRTAVTASEIAIILGISPWGSAFNLYHLKRGTIADDFEDNAMSLGRHLEPWIADRWAEGHPDLHLADAGLFASTDRLWQMSTPDRLIYPVAPADIACGCEDDPRNRCDAEPWDCPSRLSAERRLMTPVSLLEIKTSGTYDGWGEDGTDEIPAYYRAQVLWQLDTLGLAEGHVTCLFLATRQIRNYLIPFDEADAYLMRAAAQEFLIRLEAGAPPPIDHAPATTRALRELWPLDGDAQDAEIPYALAQDYRYAKLALDDAQDNYDLLTNEVRALMGSAKRAVCGETKVATRSVYERTGVDAKRLRADHPQAYAACRTTSLVDKLTPARAKKEAS